MSQRPTTKACASSDLRRQADRDQSVRLLHAYYVYPIFLGVLWFSTDIFREHPDMMRAGVGTISAALLIRLLLVFGFDSLHVASPGLWRTMLGTTVAMIGVFCGTLCGAVIYYYGYDQWTDSLVVAWVAGISAGATISFTPSRALGRMHILCVFLPVILMGIWQGTPKGNAFAVSGTRPTR